LRRSAYVGVCAFDQSTFNQTGSVNFSYLFALGLGGLARWGNDGFAFLVDNFLVPEISSTSQIISFRSGIAHVTTGSNPEPSLTFLSASVVGAPLGCGAEPEVTTSPRRPSS
jgi:hypothetical protein